MYVLSTEELIFSWLFRKRFALKNLFAKEPKKEKKAPWPGGRRRRTTKRHGQRKLPEMTRCVPERIRIHLSRRSTAWSTGRQFSLKIVSSSPRRIMGDARARWRAGGRRFKLLEKLVFVSSDRRLIESARRAGGTKCCNCLFEFHRTWFWNNVIRNKSFLLLQKKNNNLNIQYLRSDGNRIIVFLKQLYPGDPFREVERWRF